MANPTTSSSSSSVTLQEHDVEALKQKPAPANHWRIVYDQAYVTPEVLEHKYRGSGTAEEPFVVEFLNNDLRDPSGFPKWKKWMITLVVAVATLAVSFISSAFSAGLEEVIATFKISEEVGILGVSLYVLGFALGPLLWAPLSEMKGRQVLFIGTYGALTLFNIGAAVSKNIQTLLIMRFFAGSFGSSPLTNAGGVIADMFSVNERGVAISLFAVAPFLGPTIGPIVGGFVGETKGWRWLEWLMVVFSGVVWILGAFTIPETYSPVILRRRAIKMSKMTGKVYKSKLEVDYGTKTVAQEFKIALSRPWKLLFLEPIVLLLSLYMSIVYGTLYLFFSAMPIVYRVERGWSAGIGGLPFLGVAVGMNIAVAYSLWDNKRYARVAAQNNGAAPPEARLPPALVGSVALPIGLFWFAWTNSPDLHWIISIIATAPFGFGMVLVFLSCTNYLIDSYVIYAASVLAANSVIRSLFGAAFPLFSTYMYARLGIHWASSIPAFLALACVPFPYLFYKHGGAIRQKCKYAAEAAAFLEDLRKPSEDEPVALAPVMEEQTEKTEVDAEKQLAKETSRTREHPALTKVDGALLP